ncbi:hypothetical protein TEA_012758 [Camellia sinensis var. sinensis]|uniref:DEK-C domain-containing protein n=1 Tax=Camellia sinensis var. sinensis TaxID=542762 RepID=A0A4S4DZP7_CAMSN|nr:hypothetical protein TEA_012758 [Camellia sinensis var. sinensis]
MQGPLRSRITEPLSPKPPNNKSLRLSVSDQDTAEALESLLRQTNPNSTTFTSFNSIVHHLESKLGLDLTSKLDFIQNQIPPPPPPPPISLSSSTTTNPLQKFTFSSTKTLISTNPLLSPTPSSVSDHRRPQRPNPPPRFY